MFAAYFPPHTGGYEHVVAELSHRIAAFGYQVTVVTCQLGNMPRTEEWRGLRIVRLPALRLLHGTYIVPVPSLSSARLLRAALAPKPIVIQTHTRFFPTTWLGAAVACSLRRPLLHTEHGAGHSVVASCWVRWVNQLVDHTLGALVLRFGTVVAISEAAAHFSRHLGARHVRVIPDGVDLDVFASGPSDIRRQYGIGDDTVVVTFVGRLVYGKGVQDLLAAWPEVRAQGAKVGMPVRLIIVGQGPLQPVLKQQADLCEADVLFTGGLAQGEVAAVLNASDIFVSPSYTEGLGLTILEAAAVGLPIVATAIEGILDIVRDEVEGLLVPPGQPLRLAAAIVRLVSCPELRRTLGDRARHRVRSRFSWERSTETYVELLRQLERQARPAARVRSNDHG